MITPAVQAALVVLLTFALQIGAKAIGLEIDVATLNTLAGVVVVYLLSKLGISVGVRMLMGTRAEGLLKEDTK